MNRRRLWYKVTVQDRLGKILSQEEKPSHSFLRIWNELVWTQLHGINFPGSIGVTDISGNYWPLGVGTSGYNFRMNAGAQNTSYGIVIGTDDTPVTVTDYRMGALIAQGFGAGHMDYMAQVINASVVADPNCDFFMSRQMANNSGGLITVKESGLYMYMERSLSPFWTAFGCGVRDVFTTPQDVPDGGGITVEYTLRVTE
ncbi:hypothetical protein ES703_107980 [subsurface metagenome]